LPVSTYSLKKNGENMDKSFLNSVARTLVARKKGILAADESFRSTAQRFAAINLPHTVENRLAYRDMMFTTPGLEEFIAGVIMFDESIRQNAHDGRPFPEFFKSKGILSGIKVDTGFIDMAGFPGDKISEGLDGLKTRLEEYKKLGAVFAKWRAVIIINKNNPSSACIEANAWQLARYAAICQEMDVMPVVEPDVNMIGDHSIERDEEVTTWLLSEMMNQLVKQNVYLEGLLVKTNMILPGRDCPIQAEIPAVAEATLRVLKRTIPPAIPGVVFLSGGQGAQISTARLDAMNKIGGFPWELSYSFLRSMADPAFEFWKGSSKNFDTAQKELYRRGKMISAAREGKYSPDMETT
jgi:fructose-bisphosphate aldolase class I